MESIDPIRRNKVRIAGNPQAARTLVFTHGFGTDQHAWDAIVPAFERDFRIVLYDVMGMGGSDADDFVRRQHEYLNLQSYARDLLDICRALDVKDAVGIGHSVGAMITLLASIRGPAHFSRLALLCASPRYLDEEGYRGGFSKHDIAEMYRAIALDYPAWASLFAPHAMGTPQSPQFGDAFARSLQAMPKSHALTLACAIFQSDHRHELERVDKPTLLVQARADAAVPEDVARYLHAQIRGSELRMIEATGHLPHISAPQAVIEALRGFLRA
jgi:sigma-B regulation protein RsbQ